VGVGGSDRITLIWDTSGAPVFDTTWLRVTVGTTLGLAEPDVFYFGSAPGEGSGSTDAAVDGTDEIGPRNNGHAFGDLALVDDPWDYNKDRLVDGTDQIFARNNSTGFATRLELFTAPAAGPLSAGFSSGGSSSTPPLAAALIGGTSDWDALDADEELVRALLREKHFAEDERVWSNEDDAWTEGSVARADADRHSDQALQEESDWLAWDVL
jgi:hypothetical protein